jgi:hypothetical protein
VDLTNHSHLRERLGLRTTREEEMRAEGGERLELLKSDDRKLEKV